MSLPGVFGHDPVADSVRIARAVMTNVLARVAPQTYVRLTGETGRGRAPQSPEEIAAYFESCVIEFSERIGPKPVPLEWWRGKMVVEYGPGDTPGVALYLIGLGAAAVHCVDRFPLLRFSEAQQQTIRALFALLPEGADRDRFQRCFRTPGDVSSGLADGPIHYRISESGLLGQSVQADVVLSRAVLEHVNDLDATFRDMVRVARPGAALLHQVDLKSHGLHRGNPLDFLTWPSFLWHLMYGGKGAPNRLRLPDYRAAARSAGITIDDVTVMERARNEDVAAIRPYLAKPFGTLDDADLGCLSFFLRGHP